MTEAEKAAVFREAANAIPEPGKSWPWTYSNTEMTAYRSAVDALLSIAQCYEKIAETEQKQSIASQLSP